MGWLALLILTWGQCEGLNLGISTKEQTPTSFSFPPTFGIINAERGEFGKQKIAIMKRIVFILSILLSTGNAVAQSNHSIDMKLLSTSFSPEKYSGNTFKFGINLPMTLEYDSESRVKRITQYYNGVLMLEMKIVYGSDEIVADYKDLNDYRDTDYDEWKFVMSLENDRIVTETVYRRSELREIHKYTYDNQEQLMHIERDCPPEPDRNMSYDIEWSNGQPISCQQHWANGKYENILTFKYTSIEDHSLVNAFVAPIAWFDNLDSYVLPLIYCHRYYGRMATMLPQSTTTTYSIYQGKPSNKTSTHTINYDLDSHGAVASFKYDDATTVTLQWDETMPSPVNDFTIGDLKYTLLDNGESVSVIAANTEISGEVIIPSLVKNEGKMYIVKEIGENGFANCTLLSSVTIPDGLTVIGDNAFKSCSNLMQITVNQEEPPVVSASAFDGVDKTKCILKIPDGCGEKYRTAPVWKDFWQVVADGDVIVEGISYEMNEDGTVTIVSANHTAEGKYEIPSSVMIDGVEHIVTEIGANAFWGCTDMTTVTIPETICVLGDGAFAGCTNLLEVYVEGKNPAGMKTAFARMLTPGLMKEYASQFDGVDFDNCILYVPFGSGQIYREAEGWCLFKHIVEMEDLTAINHIIANSGSFDVYTITGCKVHRHSSMLKGFPKGFYIVSGRKIVVR